MNGSVSKKVQLHLPLHGYCEGGFNWRGKTFLRPPLHTPSGFVLLLRHPPMELQLASLIPLRQVQLLQPACRTASTEAGLKVLLWRGKRRKFSFKKNPEMSGGAVAWVERRYSEDGNQHVTSCQELDQSVTNKKRQEKVVSGASGKERQKKKGANEGGRSQPEETKYLSRLLNSI